MVRFAVLVAAAVLLCGPAGAACSEFQSIEPNEAKDLFDVLKNKDALTIDRSFALQKLANVREPHLRRAALEDGIRSNDSIVRGQALAEIMMQKTAFEISLVPSENLPVASRDWIKKQGGIIVYPAKFRDCVNNCIGIVRASCLTGFQIKLDGTRAELFNGALYGRFDLESDQTMKGYIKPDPRSVAINAYFRLQ